MGENNVESAEEEEELSPINPMWLIVLKWVLVVINCMYIFADSVVLIMGKSVSSELNVISESDLIIRIEGTVELIIALIGVIGLIGENFFVFAFHCISNAIYFTIIQIAIRGGGDAILFGFTLLWIIGSVFYAYHLWIRRNIVVT
jgi:hypothetical protein